MEWALNDMEYFWTTEDGAYERDGEVLSLDQLPRIINNCLILGDERTTEDLLYRLSAQYADMLYDAYSNGEMTKTAAKREHVRVQKLVEKIHEASNPGRFSFGGELNA